MKTLAASVALLTLAGVVAVACSSTTEEAQECAPGDPSCNPPIDGGDETTSETGEIDGGGDTEGDAFVLDTGTGGDAPYDPDVEYDAYVPEVEVGGGGTYVDGGLVGCVPGATQCTNCKDDDGDGLIDWLDPECTSPLDNDESSFGTGIPGDNIDPCKQDCWFDGNSGSGNDGCLFPGKCLPGSTDPKCPYDPVAAADPKQCPAPSAKCMEYCKPLTPKGCDCAGCCDIYKGDKVYTVKLVGECTYATLEDKTKCPTCTKLPECSAPPCGKCDWCLGKTSLPPECTSVPDAGPDAGPDAPPPDAPPPDAAVDAPIDTTPPPPTCPGGLAVCSPTTPCPVGQYCLTGCCIKPPS
ncbi:MAG: hypothetical protein HYV09_38550 [Deltaproteobacteria bacterium]|nr:hypothetical protein [Deltaproteobacteria bacterium]